MSADDEEVTDNIPIPVTKTSGDAPAIVIDHDGSGSPGRLRGVSGDQITVMSEAALTMDAQVQVTASGSGLASTGMVIWTREEGGQHIVGIEILGGAEEWSKLV
ncbi:MAG: hypothetical protein AAF211_08550 [Myxococcota bacterium]